MRICMISSVDMYNPYGSTTRPYYISKNLVKYGCKILHICTKPPERREKGIKYLQKSIIKTDFRLFTPPETSSECIKNVRISHQMSYMFIN